MLPNLLDKIHQQPWLKQRYVFTFIGFLTTFTVALLNFHVELIIKYIVRLNRTETDLYDKVSCPNLIVNHSGIIDDQETLLEEEKFTWDEVSVSSILGAYYGGYIWTQWLGGFAAELVGGKLVMIISIITAAILTISTPLVVMFFESYGMSNLRFITGLALGPTIPVLLSMMSKWIPKTQYTFIGSIIFPGALIGQVVAIYLTDFTVRVSGWETVCYIYGLFGLLLSVLWVFFCYSTPNMHPRISETEKEYLNENVISLKRSTKYELDPLPWKAYFFSAALWGVTIGYVSILVVPISNRYGYKIGKEWAYHLLTVEIPQFQKEVFRSDISDSLHLTSAPYICMWISAMAFGYSSDFIVKTGFVDYKKARQLFTSVGLIGSGLSIMLSVYSNCAPKHSFLWMCMGMIALGACYSGVFISVLDMTPNYAGSTMGIIDNLGITIAWVIPMLKDWIVPAGLQSQWKLLLWLMLILILVKLAVYLYFTHADQLWWDDVRSYGYPENWKGLFVTNGYIDKDLHNVFKPKKTALKAL